MKSLGIWKQQNTNNTYLGYNVQTQLIAITYFKLCVAQTVLTLFFTIKLVPKIAQASPWKSALCDGENIKANAKDTRPIHIR